MQEFTGLIYNWFELCRRDLPWRETSDPYHIWVSETILQQTQVKQGLPYYYRFISRFPDIKALAEASDDEVMKTWEGLGYYSRARNMQKAANTIVDRHNGRFPDSYEEILKLAGVGPYTAAAVASIAYGLPFAVADGNVIRVLSRYCGIPEAVDTPAGRKIIAETADKILDPSNPGFHNQAMMEFGALCCIPRNPDCQNCPLNAGCYAFSNQLTGKLPLKANRITRKVRYLYFYISENDEDMIIEKRTGNDIWKNLYQFPLYESDHELSEIEILTNPVCEEFMQAIPSSLLEISPVRIHELTHQQIRARFVRLCRSNFHLPEDPRKVVRKEEIHKFAFPVLIRNFIHEKFIRADPEE